MQVIIYSTSLLLDLKSKYDEEISLREGAEQKVTNLTQDLQKEISTVEDLKTELVFMSHSCFCSIHVKGEIYLNACKCSFKAVKLLNLQMSACGLKKFRTPSFLICFTDLGFQCFSSEEIHVACWPPQLSLDCPFSMRCYTDCPWTAAFIRSAQRGVLWHGGWKAGSCHHHAYVHVVPLVLGW